MGQGCEIQHYGVQISTFTSQTMLSNDRIWLTSAINDLNPTTVKNTYAATYCSTVTNMPVCEITTAYNYRSRVTSFAFCEERLNRNEAVKVTWTGRL